MKKLFLLTALLVWSMAVMAQVHTVQKGETLQSIAQKYNTTVANLVAVNPGVDQLFYVGLKLNIPEATAAQASVPDAQSPAPEGRSNVAKVLGAVAPQQEGTDESGGDDKPGAEFSVMLEYGFLPKTKGASGSNYTYAFTAGANYYFMHRAAGVFAGAAIGYNSANYYSYETGIGYSGTQETTAHFISVPLRIGYAITTSNRNLGISPYAGLGVNFCVGGKSKLKTRVESESMSAEKDVKKKVGIDARIGAMIRLWGFNIGGAYIFPLNKNNKMYFGDDSYFAVSIAYGF